MHRASALGVAAIAAAWGLIGLFVRWSRLPPVAVVFCRTASATVALAVALGAHRWYRSRSGAGPRPGAGAAGRRGRRRTPAWVLGLLGVILGTHWLCLVAAQERAPLGTVLLITYLAPVLVMLGTPRLLAEHVPPRTYLAVGLGLAGVAVLARPTSGFGAGEIFALLAAVTYAALTLGSKFVVAEVGGVHLAFIQLAVATVALAPFAATTDWGGWRPDWLWMVLVGVLFTALLGSIYLVLLGRLPAATVGVLTYVEPVSAVLVGWAFFGEVPTAGVAVGGALVVLAGIMVLPRAATPVSARDRSVPVAPR